jgi:SAM-dependent methyltransferase
MVTDYDRIGEKYRNSKELPFRRHVELYTYFEILGDLKGKTVLDLACGDGYYTRRVHRRGAAAVVGVDLSSKMIALARAKTAGKTADIHYRVGDARSLGSIGDFDVVIAAYLLNYARSGQELQDMCGTIAVNLKTGGRFVGINNNPSQPPASFPSCRKYGFTKTLRGPLVPGASIVYRFLRRGQRFEIENYYLDRDTHERAFQQAGFRRFRWCDVVVSPEGTRRHGKAFWRDFMTFQPITAMEALK